MRSPFDNNGGRDRDPVREISSALRQNVYKHWPFAVGLVVAILALTGVYSVGPGEQGVVRTFGRESGKTDPGLHYSIPLVQQVDVVNLEQVRRIEVGFRGAEPMLDESLMLTGDENIVKAEMIVQYQIKDSSMYLFRLRDADQVLHATAEVALRSMVGRTKIDGVMTTGRQKVEQDTREWIQRLMDDYQSGISITEVKLQSVDAPAEVQEAFHDVVRAREEKEKFINQAKAYEADVIPRARGEAAKMERAAEGYRQRRILEAEGDAAKFNLTYAEYEKAKRVTRERLYLETIERILGKIERTTLVDGDVARSTLPVLPLGGGAPIPGPAAPAGGQ